MFCREHLGLLLENGKNRLVCVQSYSAALFVGIQTQAEPRMSSLQSQWIVNIHLANAFNSKEMQVKRTSNVVTEVFSVPSATSRLGPRITLGHAEGGLQVGYRGHRARGVRPEASKRFRVSKPQNGIVFCPQFGGRVPLRNCWAPLLFSQLSLQGRHILSSLC